MEVWKKREPDQPINPYMRQRLVVTEISKKELPYCFVPESANMIRNRCVSKQCPEYIKSRCDFKTELMITGGSCGY